MHEPGRNAPRHQQANVQMVPFYVIISATNTPMKTRTSGRNLRGPKIDRQPHRISQAVGLDVKSKTLHSLNGFRPQGLSGRFSIIPPYKSLDKS